MNLIGFLGLRKDATEHGRTTFRPSVALCMHKELPIKDYYLIHPSSHFRLLKKVIADINKVSPETRVHPIQVEFKDPFDPLMVFEKLLEFSKTLTDDEYLISLATGTHMQTYGWIRLIESQCIRAKFIQIYANNLSEASFHSGEASIPGEYRVIDLERAHYDRYHALLSDLNTTAQTYLKNGIATKNVAYNDMITQIESISLKSHSSLLLEGPTGAGKTALATRLYDLKKKHGVVTGSFVMVNCATLQPEQAQSVLFGHHKGAFTGAATSRDGFLRKADQGVLFLDEIGCLSLEVQGMLLHALEDHSFYPMGSDQSVESRFTLFCGTNVNLHQLVAQGRFRDDLLARIDLWNFRLPSLSERREDIEPNIDYELNRFFANQKKRVRFNREARADYLKFAMDPTTVWTRNFRDLSGSVERMCTLSEHGIINQENVINEIQRLHHSWTKGSYVAKDEIGNCADTIINDHAPGLSYIDRLVLRETIKTCIQHETLSQAARVLYDTEDSSTQNPAGRLNNYLARYQLDYKKLKTLFATHR